MVFNSLFNVLKPELVLRHDSIVRNIGFLMSLTDKNKDLISWEDFTGKKSTEHRNPIRYIEYALQLTNVAIAQQSIFAGEILLPIIFNEVYNYQSGSGDTTKFKVCESLLIQNGLLATNFTNYFIGTYLKTTRQSELQYGYAYNSKDSLTMSNVIKNVFPITYVKSGDTRLNSRQLKEGWYIVIDKSLYQLPDPTQIDKTPLIQSQYLSGLLYNREKLLQQLFSYNAYETKTSQNLNYLIMKN
jgi:hypothetical protein